MFISCHISLILSHLVNNGFYVENFNTNENLVRQFTLDLNETRLAQLVGSSSSSSDSSSSSSKENESHHVCWGRPKAIETSCLLREDVDETVIKVRFKKVKTFLRVDTSQGR